MSNALRYGLPIAFATLLIVAWADAAFFGALTQVQSFDNKAKKPAPALRLDHLDPFPRDAEAWFNDNFPWRGLFQRLNGQLRAVTNRRSPLPDLVVLGEDDWLYKGGLQLDIYRGKRRFSPEELRKVTAELLARKDSIEARGGQYYLAIAPLKHHIYSQYLPGHVRPLNQEYAVRQLYAALGSTDLRYIDLHTPLQTYAALHPPLHLSRNPAGRPKTNAETHNLYYRTDHHWTVRAGLLATQTILAPMIADGHPILPIDTSTYTFINRSSRGMTLAQMAGLDRENQDHFLSLHHNWTTDRAPRPNIQSPPKFPYPNSYVKARQQKDPILRQSLPSLFVTRESFGENLLQPLSDHFGCSYFLFDEWNHELNLDHYDREGGDVYIQLIWEGFLFNLLEIPEEDGKW